MDDLSGLISQVLSDPSSVQQLQQVAASLGLTEGSEAQTDGRAQTVSQNQPQQSSGNMDLDGLSKLLSELTGKQQAAAQPQAPAPQLQPDLSALAQLLGGGQPAPPPQPAQQNMPDLSALAGLLGGSGGGQASNSGGGSPDLSALSGLLSGLGGGGDSNETAGGAPDLSALSGLLGGLGGGSVPAGNSSVGALANMLGGGSDSGQSAPMGLNLDTILKVQQAMATMSANQDNVRLLLAMKGHLKDEDRIKKVDDAIRVMQIIQFLPLLKDSGLFGGLEDLIGGFNGDSAGGLGGILNRVTSGNGLGGLLGSAGGSGGLGSLLGGLTSRGGLSSLLGGRNLLGGR